MGARSALAYCPMKPVATKAKSMECRNMVYLQIWRSKWHGKISTSANREPETTITMHLNHREQAGRDRIWKIRMNF
jgi:abortive infection bacteriophage resistance protein